MLYSLILKNLTMRYLIPISFIFCIFSFHNTYAEGTKELAPNGNITIQGNLTNDIAALWIDRDEFNNFASYTNPDTNSRLYIHIEDPSTECVYLGFSAAHPNFTGMNPPLVTFEFRIKDPAGNVVYGPIVVNPADANINTWQEAVNGPNEIVGSGGFDAFVVPNGTLNSAGWNMEGDFYIEFENNDNNVDGFLIDYWDIAVEDCSDINVPDIKLGRLWSYNWSLFAINDFGFPVRPFNGKFFVCAPDVQDPSTAFITAIDFNESGFMPAAFNVAFNSFGATNTGDIQMNRRSVFNANTTQSEYAIFLNDPVDICETAEIGTVEFLGLSRCDVDQFNIKYIASKGGLFDILLDFDGADGMFTAGTADVLLTQQVELDQIGQVSCVEWDGLDGSGNSVANMGITEIPIRISLALGIVHFPIYDAEFMEDGFQIIAVRPLADQPLLFYDDSEISVPSGSGESPVELNGCTIPCHQWTNFTDNNVVGFGNRCTINSWWFSQRIIQTDMLAIPSYFECNITGPAEICDGATATLNVSLMAVPESSDMAEIIDVVWTSTVDFDVLDQTSITINTPGNYSASVQYTGALGDTCETSCEYVVELLPAFTATIDTLILEGEEIIINGETYNQGGVYTQTLVASNGCDSILTINVSELQTVIRYSLDDCRSYASDSTDMDYSEFLPEEPNPLNCANIEASNLFRNFPNINKHSCTPGVDDLPAICVGSLDNCDFEADNNDQSLYLEFTVVPSTDTAVAFTGFSFYEKAPQMFSWIDGSSGLNNPPTLYGITILKDGIEIFREINIPTTDEWTLEEYSFIDNPDFYTASPATFQIRLLGYCLFGNLTSINAWDIDEINIQASCVSPGAIGTSIIGTVSTANNQILDGVKVELSDDPFFYSSLETMTADDGSFKYHFVKGNNPHYLKASNNTDILDGVGVLDLIAIQKHVMGLEKLTNPDQLIAADINKSRSISPLDMVILRKVLLGLDDEFQNNTSWRLGSETNLLSEVNFWNFDDPQIIDMSTNENYISLKGVKIGDVNRSLNQQYNGFENRSQNEIAFLEYQDQYLQKGESADILFAIKNDPLIEAIQLVFEFSNIEVEAIISGSIGLKESDAALFQKRNDDVIMKMIWLNNYSNDTESENYSFGIQIKAKADGLLSDLIEVNNEELESIIIYNNGKEKADIKLHRLIKAY